MKKLMTPVLELRMKLGIVYQHVEPGDDLVFIARRRVAMAMRRYYEAMLAGFQ